MKRGPEGALRDGGSEGAVRERDSIGSLDEGFF